MKCPECGTGALLVKDSRDRGGEVYRRRVCDRCGLTIKTTELPMASLNTLQKRANSNAHTGTAIVKRAIRSLQEAIKT